MFFSSNFVLNTFPITFLTVLKSTQIFASSYHFFSKLSLTKKIMFQVKTNWKETATNTVWMFKCLFSYNLFHLMKKVLSGNKQVSTCISNKFFPHAYPIQSKLKKNCYNSNWTSMKFWPLLHILYNFLLLNLELTCQIEFILEPWLT
jgi:hypothetical protein